MTKIVEIQGNRIVLRSRDGRTWARSERDLEEYERKVAVIYMRSRITAALVNIGTVVDAEEEIYGSANRIRRNSWNR